MFGAGLVHVLVGIGLVLVRYWFGLCQLQAHEKNIFF